MMNMIDARPRYTCAHEKHEELRHASRASTKVGKHHTCRRGSGSDFYTRWGAVATVCGCRVRGGG